MVTLKPLSLYSGPHCGLCEQARQQIWPVLSRTGQQLVEVDITTDTELLRKYRRSIPVLSDSNGRELFWPFDSARLEQWLREDECS